MGENCDRAYNETCVWTQCAPFDLDQIEQANKSPREKGVIVYACCADALGDPPAYSSSDVYSQIPAEFDDLVWSLKLLDLAFNDFFNYPVVIFYSNMGEPQFNVFYQLQLVCVS